MMKPVPGRTPAAAPQPEPAAESPRREAVVPRSAHTTLTGAQGNDTVLGHDGKPVPTPKEKE